MSEENVERIRELYAAFRDIVHRIHATGDRLGVPREEITGAINGEDSTDFTVERDRILLVLEPIETRVQNIVRRIGEADVKIMKANEVYAFTAREMKRDPHLLYYIDKQKDKEHS